MQVNLGRHLFSFADFDDWCDTAKVRFARAGVDGRSVLSVDQNGRVCGWGKHFMVARDDGSFPIDVYLLREDMDAEARG